MAREKNAIPNIRKKELRREQKKCTHEKRKPGNKDTNNGMKRNGEKMVRTWETIDLFGKDNETTLYDQLTHMQTLAHEKHTLHFLLALYFGYKAERNLL